MHYRQTSWQANSKFNGEIWSEGPQRPLAKITGAAVLSVPLTIQLDT
jgi:hypothetical protein